MKSWLIAVLIAAVSLTLAPSLAEAKRFGGGKSFGMQRSAPPPQRAPEAPRPAQPAGAAVPAAGAAGAAAAGSRSWLAPVAGLAAGLGLVALMSHLGLGEELASFVMLALLAMAAVFVFRLLMRRGGAPARPALAAGTAPSWREATTPGAGQGGGASGAVGGSDVPVVGSALRPRLAVAGVDADGAAHVGAAAGPALPPGFDAGEFERIARAIFIRMQTAYDAGDLNDLRQFTTPEIFAELRLQLQERGDAAQHTDVVEVHAQVIEVAEEDGQQIVSVRYHGRAVEEAGATAQPFDEVWHLVRPLDGSRAWAIAGVQQRASV